MRKLFYIFILLLIISDIVLFTLSSDIRIFGILFIYIFFVKLLKLKSNASFVFSLIFLVLAYSSFIFSDVTYFANPGPNIPFSEKAAVWTFLFMIIGIVQKWKE